MQVEQVIPIFRIFDYNKAVEFYIDWLGLQIDWEHRFDDHAPIYMQVSGNGLTLHLSEHHGDATPGSQAFVYCKELKGYHEELIQKNYKYNKPGFEETFYNCYCVQVIDPFGNRISFNEPIKER
ncbi:glyoxalase superfamily protein [Sphingobacterium cellulitidis]|uniref:glyoxalase superfamily protein n=1 Tax=Sphingobacterium cellulitidis TaxID=1768011 RepID=UPI003C7B95B7